MKFKVGDKVRVIKNKISLFSVDCVGEVGTVIGYGKRNLTKDDAYDIKFDIGSTASHYWWVDEELELVEAKPFTKSDLKDGMVVEYRNGERALYNNKRFLGEHGGMSLGTYEDDLTRSTLPILRMSDGKPSYDIMKVYETSAGSLPNLFKDDRLTLIWERKEKPTHKYKPGDKVKVKADLEAYTPCDGVGIVPDMAFMGGRVVTIRECSVYPGKYYIEDCDFIWSDGCFEDGVIDYEEMTVAEIEKKLGYKVKIVDGE